MSRLPAIALALVVVTSLPVAAHQQPGSPADAPSRVAVAKVKPRGLTTIQGNALDSTNGQMRNVMVRLRDARFGRIVDTQLTDQAGLFAFKAVDPGTYIVEMVSNDQSVLAASQLLNVNAGDAVSAVVKLPLRAFQVAGVMGGTTSSAAIIAAQAIASTIAAVVPTSPVSPNQ